jgi:hypothetical protein
MYQVVDMTDEQKREMYSKLSKEELIEILIENNNIIERLNKMHILPIVNVQQFPTLKLEMPEQDLNPYFPTANWMNPNKTIVTIPTNVYKI